MKMLLLLITMTAVSFAACTDDKGAGNTGGTKREQAERKNNPASKIRNGIELHAKDVTVSQAFLMYDDGKLVPEGNETTVGTPVKIRLVMDKGWEGKDGMVRLGASERIETSDGDLVLHEKDLFESTGAMPAEGTRILSLTATISSLDKLYDYFLVSFRVWDKNGPGEVTGSYKLYIR